MPTITPTLTLPHKGGGKIVVAQLFSPSPLMGEGWGGGDSSVSDHEYYNAMRSNTARC